MSSSSSSASGRPISLKHLLATNMSQPDTANSVSVQQRIESHLHTHAPITDIPAIFGSLKLNSGIYLCIVGQSREVARLQGQFIVREAMQCHWVCVFHPKRGHAHNENLYIALLNAATNRYGSFYFVEGNDSNGSIEWDLTRVVQKQAVLRGNLVVGEHQSHSVPLSASSSAQQSSLNSAPNSSSTFTFLAPNDEFFWNRHASMSFLNAGLVEFVTPMIKGFVTEFDVQIKKQEDPVHFWLISRLSCKRAGTRYHTRGLDEFGNVANFVETEQVMQFKNHLSSFVQIRGSIPLFWDQAPDLSYNPAIKLQQRNSSIGFQAHMENQINSYGNVICISLVNLKGVELALANEFEKQHKLFNNPKVRYIAWDFHKECSGMRYSNIKKLISKIEEDMTQFGYFSYNTDTCQVEREQTGVIRSNCKDCLDRTNVVMSVIAKLMLKRNLESLHLIKPKQTINRVCPKLSYHFKLSWADNGDALSHMYAGTGALKADFTRTGKRTFYGLLQDFQNSATRYYLNNFSDGVKQDSINLLLGKHDVFADQSPFTDNLWSYVYTALCVALVVGILGSAASVFLFFVGSNFKRRFVDLCFWIMFTVAVYVVLKKNGRDVANQPILRIEKALASSQSTEWNDENKKTE